MIRSRERSRGQVLAEFTLVIPLFMLIVLSIAEGGYYVAATTMVNSATHEGARLAVLQSTSSPYVIQNRVVDAAPMLGLRATDVSFRIAKVTEDGTYTSLSTCDNSCYGSRKKDDRIVVDTTYTHRPFVSYVFGSVTFPGDASAELTVEADAL